MARRLSLPFRRCRSGSRSPPPQPPTLISSCKQISEADRWKILARTNYPLVLAADVLQDWWSRAELNWAAGVPLILEPRLQTRDASRPLLTFLMEEVVEDPVVRPDAVVMIVQGEKIRGNVASNKSRNLIQHQEKTSESNLVLHLLSSWGLGLRIGV